MAKAIPFNKENLEFILFDACLMSSIEVLYDLRDKAKYVIASPRLGGFKDTEVAKLHDVEVKQEDAEHSHGVSDRNEPWRQELRQKVAGKERTSIERVHMPETAPRKRL